MRVTRTVKTISLFGILALLASGCLSAKDNKSDTAQNSKAKNVTLTIASNSISGGKSSEEADWITKYVIPEFVKQQKAKGVTAKVTFNPSGVDDEQYKAKLALDLKTRGGADVLSLDGIWIGEFAEAGYIKPLDEVVGAKAKAWDGWSQIPESVQEIMKYNNKNYGIPGGTDGRVLFYNKALFAKAGISVPWQPKSWDEILATGRALKKVSGVTPIQINAGTAMGEATTMQGVLPLLVGTGKGVYDQDTKKWQGASTSVKSVLNFYKEIYGGGLGDPILQQEAKGRDKSFQEFAAGKIGILLEGDYFWRSVIEPKAGVAPMKNRDRDVGYAKIPAEAPGKGLKGQDFVTMMGGGGRVINPNTKYPQQAFELLAFMNSAEAVKAALAGTTRITQRTDVNDEVLKRDPMLQFVASEVAPLGFVRPGLAVYPQVSSLLQQATGDIVSGKSPEEAAAAYQVALEKAVGGADHVDRT
ncbi:MAG: extracellular solute-binding protein [Mycobacteriales bacterium]